MSINHRQVVGCLLVVVVVIGIARPVQSQDRGPARPEIRGIVKAIDTAGGSITVSFFEGRQATSPTEKSYPISKNAEVVIGTSLDGGRSAFVAKEGKLTDLVAGAAVTLSLSSDQAVVEGIVAEGPQVRGLLKAVDAVKNTISVSLMTATREQTSEDKSYALAPDGEVAVDHRRGRRFSIKEGRVADLAAGAAVMLRLSLDQKQVLDIQAEGPRLYGVIKSLNASQNSLTVTLPPSRGADSTSERTLELASNGVVLLDDGKGRRLSIKEGKLSDLPVGTAVSLRLSVDQRFVGLVRAEGPNLPGQIKSVDSANGTVTILTRVARGENPEEKTYPVAKDARIVIDGNEVKLADIKTGDDGRFVMLRLSLDQKSVQGIMAQQSR
ncbi:MAG: hypothetical protein HZA46_01110 [Planctomycetales bacterium]|nr:hypothetical protein [Planctomycetales bacterium]